MTIFICMWATALGLMNLFGIITLIKVLEYPSYPLNAIRQTKVTYIQRDKKKPFNHFSLYDSDRYMERG